MSRYDAILVPHDGSAEAAKAMRCAAWLAERLDALLHVVCSGAATLEPIGDARAVLHRTADAPEAAVLEEFDHPLWRAIEEQSKGAGHGGMDYIEDYRLIQCLREGKPTDMNVYDAASLSAVVDLSVMSTASRSRTVDFPDFTRNRWRTNPKLEIDARLMTPA